MMDLKELFYEIDSRIPPSADTSTSRLAKELEVNAELIEQTVRGVVGTSFREYLESKKLANALKSLEENRNRTMERAEQRTTIPGTTVSYLLRGRGIRSLGRSGPYPLYDLSRGGIAFLCDHPMKPGRELLAIIECTKLPITLLLGGRVAYAVAQNQADFRYRIGVQFKPFGPAKGSNPPKSLEYLTQLMGVATCFDVMHCECDMS